MNKEQKTGLYLRQMEQIHIYNVAIIQVMMVTDYETDVLHGIINNKDKPLIPASVI
jgi:hypothetical protein